MPEPAPPTPSVVVTTEQGGPPAAPPATWAAAQLVDALRQAGITVGTERSAAAAGPPPLGIEVSGPTGDTGHTGDTDTAAGPGSFRFARPSGAAGPVVVSAPDATGLVYGLLELADRVRYAPDPLAVLRGVEPAAERPATPVRSILRTFCCEVEDKPWFYDRDFWTEYLTELATHRISRFQLALGMQYNYPGSSVTDNYLCFPYPFLLDVPGYDVRAGGVSDDERAENLRTLKFIAEETVRRGMQFQLGLWNHAYEQSAAEPLHPISGLTPDTHAAYCATALVQLLRECPWVSGLSLRVHHEGGIPDPDRPQFWGPVLRAVGEVGRPIELDMHAKGVDEAMLDLARPSGMPLVLGAKYWAEHQGLPYHQAAIREKEAAHRGSRTGVSSITSQRRFTRYGVGDFLTEGRDYDILFRIWPGTQKLLLWGDPALAAGYGRLSTLAGSIGAELCEPLTFKGRANSGREGERDPYVDPALQLGNGTWKKYRLTYRLWGRLMYDPDARPDGWRRYLRAEFQSAAEDVEAALAAASRVLPLVTVVHGLSGSNNRYWPEMYLNMPIAGGPNADFYEGDTADPPTFGAVSSFDPALFCTVNEFADDLLAGRRDGRYTPHDTAGWLDDLAATAEDHLERATAKAADPQDPTFRRAAVDIAVQAGLARFFAGKTRAGLAYALFERTADPAQLAAAIGHYRSARAAFAGVAELTTGVYRADLTFGSRVSEHGHWADRIADIDADIADLERRQAAADAGSAATDRPAAAGVPDIPDRSRPRVDHAPPAAFARGRDLPLTVTSAEDLAAVRLHYRHLNQAETFEQVAMAPAGGGRYTATIPGAYTDSAYPLVYYFTLHHGSGNAWLVPGLQADLANQPYHLVRVEGAGR